MVLTTSRWIVVILLLIFGIQKKSLTTWIFISMVVGAEIGYDFPEAADALKVVSKAFLKLIKSIVAPLLFGTLVVGIAGHSNIKQVGRMGIKSLLYFEVVTTIALFVGLAAINITQAGAGVTLTATNNTEKMRLTAVGSFCIGSSMGRFY